MTEAEFLALTPEKQAALVATHVMDWKPWVSPCVPHGSAEPDCWLTGDPQSPTLLMTGWRPTEDIADAWQVVKKITEQGWRLTLYANPPHGSIKPAAAGFGAIGQSMFGRCETADTAPLAINLAALKAAEVIV